MDVNVQYSFYWDLYLCSNSDMYSQFHLTYNPMLLGRVLFGVLHRLLQSSRVCKQDGYYQGRIKGVARALARALGGVMQ